MEERVFRLGSSPTALQPYTRAWQAWQDGESGSISLFSVVAGFMKESSLD